MTKHAIRLLACAAGLGAMVAAGCTTDSNVRVRGTATVTSGPTLVEIRPGVWVVEDYHSPVFWSDGYYWLYSDGYWYRSGHDNRAWIRVRHRVVPRPIVQIERPRRYIRYHAREHHNVRKGPPRVRDHRDRPRPRRADPPPRRDHREQPRRSAPPPRRGERDETRVPSERNPR